MITWPNDLPQDFRRTNYVEGLVDNIIELLVDNGPSMRRPRYTRQVIIYQGEMLMTTLQYIRLKRFYYEDLNAGQEKFIFTGLLGNIQIVKFIAFPERRKVEQKWLVSLNFRD